MRKCFARHGQMPKVGTIELPTAVPVALRVQWARVHPESSRLQIDLSFGRGPGGAMPCITGRCDAVEEVTAAGDGLEKVVRIPNPHEVAGMARGKFRVKHL